VALALGIGTARGAWRRGAQAAAALPQPLAEVWLALLVPVLSLFAMVWLLFSELRYRVPFDVFVFPLALWGWKESLAAIAARLRGHAVSGRWWGRRPCDGGGVEAAAEPPEAVPEAKGACR